MPHPFTQTLILSATLICVAFGQLRINAVELLTAADPGLIKPQGASGDSSAAVVSPDGQWIAFASSAPDLVSNPKLTRVLDVFLWHRETRAITLVSLSTNGVSAGDGNSVPVAFSSDNRYLLIEGHARNLVTNSVTGDGDIYRCDLAARTITLVSVDRDGLAGGNGLSTVGSFSPDGRFVTFDSVATNLVDNDFNQLIDVFQRDMQEGVTRLVSINVDGTSSATSRLINPAGSLGGSASRDGRHVIFCSDAADVCSLYSGYLTTVNLYLRDTLLATNIPITVTTIGGLANSGVTGNATLSTDGRYVAFESSATSLGEDYPIGTKAISRVYWRDMADTNLVLVHPLTGTNRTVPNGNPIISSDGLRVVYEADGQIYAWDALARTNFLVSVTPQGQPANGPSMRPGLSADANIVVFTSSATDLVETECQGTDQVYRRDLRTGVTTLISLNHEQLGGASTDCSFDGMDATASVIALTVPDADLATNDINGRLDVFCRVEPDDVAGSGVVLLVSQPQSSALPETANGYSTLLPGAVSVDGRRVAFASRASNLNPLDPDPNTGVFIRDRDQAANILASLGSDGITPGNVGAFAPVLDPSGSRVLFVSAATNLVANDTNTLEDLFLRDLNAGTTALVSQRPEGYGRSRAMGTPPPCFSADSRYLAWSMFGHTGYDVFWRDLRSDNSLFVITNLPSKYRGSLSSMTFAGGASLLLHAGYPNANLLYSLNTGLRFLSFTSSIPPAVTPDGRFMAWQTVANSNFTLGRFDLATDTSLILAAGPGPQRVSQSRWQLSISADGRFIAFVQPVDIGSRLAPAYVDQVMIADASQPGRVDLVSFSPQTGRPGGGASGNPALSPNGRYLTFRSDAPDLVPNDQNGLADIFVRDLQAGVTWLASARPDGSSGNERALGSPQMSADGSTVVFQSAASDLVPDDLNQLADIFAFTVPVISSPDTDQDGMADAWEMAQFGDLSHDGSTDSDLDGRTDHEEYVAGTLPLNPASQFEVEAAPANAGGKVKLAWKAAPERKYRIQFSDDLGLGAWQDLAVPPVADGDNLTVEDPSEAPLGSRFYRVLVYP